MKSIIDSVPEGYVYLGQVKDINIPQSWRDMRGFNDTADFAYFCEELDGGWRVRNRSWVYIDTIHLAAKPGTLLYKMNTPPTTLKKQAEVFAKRIEKLKKENEELRAKLQELKRLFDTL